MSAVPNLIFPALEALEQRQAEPPQLSTADFTGQFDKQKARERDDAMKWFDENFRKVFPPTVGRFTLFDLENGVCRWPIGEHPNVVFCGAPADGPYCACHHALAYRDESVTRPAT